MRESKKKTFSIREIYRSKDTADEISLNLLAIAGHIFICAVIALAHFLEVLNGSRTITYYLILIGIALIPIITEMVIFRKDPGSKKIQYCFSYGFLMFYGLVCFTTNSIAAYTYIIPILILLSLFNNKKFSVPYAIVANVININGIIYFAMKGRITPENIPDMGIRAFVIAVISLYVILVADAIGKINQKNKNHIEEDKKKTEDMLNKTLSISNTVSDGLNKMLEHMENLCSSTELSVESIAEVQTGNHETAESIQNQMIKSENIHKSIENINSICQSISENMDNASNKVTNGLTSAESLKKQSEASGIAMNETIDVLNNLSNETTKMQEMVTNITGIANQTSLLALNASIEAARAGESGRGFAVVAESVSNLAHQSKEAAVEITSLIESVLGEIKQINASVGNLKLQSDLQQEQTLNVIDGLSGIATITNNIVAQTKELESSMIDALTDNAEVVAQTENISAITEELSAKSTETLEECNKNLVLMQAMQNLTKDINASAMELKKL